MPIPLSFTSVLQQKGAKQNVPAGINWNPQGQYAPSNQMPYRRPPQNTVYAQPMPTLSPLIPPAPPKRGKLNQIVNGKRCSQRELRISPNDYDLGVQDVQSEQFEPSIDNQRNQNPRNNERTSGVLNIGSGFPHSSNHSNNYPPGVGRKTSSGYHNNQPYYPPSQNSKLLTPTSTAHKNRENNTVSGFCVSTSSPRHLGQTAKGQLFGRKSSQINVTKLDNNRYQSRSSTNIAYNFKDAKMVGRGSQNIGLQYGSQATLHELVEQYNNNQPNKIDILLKFYEDGSYSLVQEPAGESQMTRGGQSAYSYYGSDYYTQNNPIEYYQATENASLPIEPYRQANKAQPYSSARAATSKQSAHVGLSDINSHDHGSQVVQSQTHRQEQLGLQHHSANDGFIKGFVNGLHVSSRNSEMGSPLNSNLTSEEVSQIVDRFKTSLKVEILELASKIVESELKKSKQDPQEDWVKGNNSNHTNTPAVISHLLPVSELQQRNQQHFQTLGNPSDKASIINPLSQIVNPNIPSNMSHHSIGFSFSQESPSKSKVNKELENGHAAKDIPSGGIGEQNRKNTSQGSLANYVYHTGTNKDNTIKKQHIKDCSSDRDHHGKTSGYASLACSQGDESKAKQMKSNHSNDSNHSIATHNYAIKIKQPPKNDETLSIPKCQNTNQTNCKQNNNNSNINDIKTPLNIANVNVNPIINVPKVMTNNIVQNGNNITKNVYTINQTSSNNQTNNTNYQTNNTNYQTNNTNNNNQTTNNANQTNNTNNTNHTYSNNNTYKPINSQNTNQNNPPISSLPINHTNPTHTIPPIISMAPLHPTSTHSPSKNIAIHSNQSRSKGKYQSGQIMRFNIIYDNSANNNNNNNSANNNNNNNSEISGISGICSRDNSGINNVIQNVSQTYNQTKNIINNQTNNHNKTPNNRAINITTNNNNNNNNIPSQYQISPIPTIQLPLPTPSNNNGQTNINNNTNIDRVYPRIFNQTHTAGINFKDNSAINRHQSNGNYNMISNQNSSNINTISNNNNSHTITHNTIKNTINTNMSPQPTNDTNINGQQSYKHKIPPLTPTGKDNNSNPNNQLNNHNFKLTLSSLENIISGISNGTTQNHAEVKRA